MYLLTHTHMITLPCAERNRCVLPTLYGFYHAAFSTLDTDARVSAEERRKHLVTLTEWGTAAGLAASREFAEDIYKATAVLQSSGPNAVTVRHTTSQALTLTLTHTCMYTFTRTHTHTHARAHTRTNTRACTRSHAHTHSPVHCHSALLVLTTFVSLSLSLSLSTPTILDPTGLHRHCGST